MVGRLDSIAQDDRANNFAVRSLPRLRGTLAYRTAQDGAVMVSSDGHSLWIEAER